MDSIPIIPVILAGGNGSRLWPLSRELYPKQFLCVKNDLTLLQSTLLRLKGLNCERPIIITNENHRFVVAEQVKEISNNGCDIILEPCGKNTAPAVALAALSAQKRKLSCEPLLLILASDHLIQNEKMFEDAIIEAKEIASNGGLVTFGIIPEYAETGYGYIHRGDELSDIKKGFFFKIKKFVEKPDAIKAEKYLRSGDFFWNSGMFLFTASTYLDELEKFRSDIYKVCEKAFFNASIDLDFIRIPKDIFMSCPSESIDYAIMEKTCGGVVRPVSIGWSDVGSWKSIWEINEKDSNGNVLKGDVIALESSNNLIYSDSGLVAALGINDAVIIQTKDATLISTKDKAQDIKNIVNKLKNLNRKEYYAHKKRYRPWGDFESIDDGERYNVKKIIVKAGEGLSLRMHHHRSEHWIVLSGTAKVTMNENIKMLYANESVYIPQGAIYSLENPGVIPLQLIEVSSGDYLGEDDIVRKKERYK
jgi:mannose-1-phosphate guanylyltransferase